MDQMAAIWSPVVPDSSGVGCTGAPTERFFGPGIWVHTVPSIGDYRFDAELHELFFSASWVDLRTRFPPGSADTRYLQWQGVKGLIWGKNIWSAASDGIPFPKRSKDLKTNDWTPRGTAYIQSPGRWRYPSLYSINGTNYTRVAEGLYKNHDGMNLNLNLDLELRS